MNQPTQDQPIKDLELPAPHILAMMVDANETYVPAGRGTWKTTNVIAFYTLRKVYQMPRSSGVIVGLSFEHLGDNTIPPLLHSWAEKGIIHGEHYVYGLKPPDEWEKPYLGVINGKYDHCISFNNGTVIHLVSLKKKASANGISAQWGVFDEAKFMKEKMLVDEIFPIFRGNEKQFGHMHCYLSKLFATDKLADPAKIKWILKKKNLSDPKRVEIIVTLQKALTALEMEYHGSGVNKQKQLKPKIHQIESKLNKLRTGMVYYLEISALDVVPIMGERWLKDKQRNLGKQEFDVSILNKDPDRAGESFYPDFALPLHTYKNPFDINPVKGFIIAADYQHSIAPICVAQLGKLPGADEVTLNYVDEVYTVAKQVDNPEPNGNGSTGGLSLAVQLFCDRYKKHPTKRVQYVYDHTAVGRRVDADKYADIVIRILKKNKWSVRKVFTGHAPLHYQKHTDTKAWMTHDDPSTPAIQINSARCPKTIASIQGAAAMTVNGKTEKNKKNETDPNLDQSETTHFSDVFDQINDAVLKRKMIKSSGGGGVGARVN